LHLSIEISYLGLVYFCRSFYYANFNQDLVSCLSYQDSIGIIILDEIILHISDLFKITLNHEFYMFPLILILLCNQFCLEL
jgi:hypothetical protein